MSRTVKDIQNEYLQKCANAGDLQYRIACLTEDLKVLNDQLKALNAEAAALPPETPSEG